MSSLTIDNDCYKDNERAGEHEKNALITICWTTHKWHLTIYSPLSFLSFRGADISRKTGWLDWLHLQQQITDKAGTVNRLMKTSRTENLSTHSDTVFLSMTVKELGVKCNDVMMKALEECKAIQNKHH